MAPRRRPIKAGDRVRSDEHGMGTARWFKDYWQGSYGDWVVEFDAGKQMLWVNRNQVRLVERGGSPISDRVDVA